MFNHKASLSFRKATKTTLTGAFGLSLLAWIGATPAQGQGAPLTVNGVNYTISTKYNTFYALKTDLITTHGGVIRAKQMLLQLLGVIAVKSVGTLLAGLGITGPISAIN